MIRICWLDLNASYSHASLALPAIEANSALYRGDEKLTWRAVSCTTRSSLDAVLVDLLAEECDLLCATAWLFTHPFLLEIVARFRQLRPQTVVCLGGPEFLGDNETYLRSHSTIDCVFRGDGEEGFYRFLAQFRCRSEWRSVAGLCFLHDGGYVDGGLCRVEHFAALTAPSASRFFPIDKPFVQLESNRGCYNTCAFCVSGGEGAIQWLTLEQIRGQLDYFVAQGIREIRLLDRTFNSHPRRALEMLTLFETYLSRLSFHLEIHPALLTAAIREKLALLPAGLLHLEAGVQSLRQTVIDRVGRKGSVDQVVDGLRFLFSLRTMETHVDLIAGLPNYSFRQLVEDTEVLIGMGAAEIQIELLKLLPGTRLRDEALSLSLCYSPLPPYEVLQTPAISYEELCRSMVLSRVVDIYYNDSSLQQLFRLLVSEQRGFLCDWVDYASRNKLFEQPLRKERSAWLLAEYVASVCPSALSALQACWLEAGLSLYKVPYAETTPYKEQLPATVETICGQLSSEQRIYRVASSECVWFVGFDRSVSQSKPQFIGRLIS